jgi:Ceramidase
MPSLAPRARLAILAALAIAATAILFGAFPPLRQDAAYHQFADRRVIAGIPNFWNVVSNLPFLAVALWGLRAFGCRAAFLERWERAAYAVLLLGLALVALGSGYYHWHPDSATLVWDRLPMTVVFMSLLASTIGERTGMRAGRWLLVPLLGAGIGSVAWWVATGDLRAYGLVQFYPVAALPLMLGLFPPRYTGTSGLWAMVGFYALAKILESCDGAIAAVVATGGHPWKHLAAAAAMWCYVKTVAGRTAIPLPQDSRLRANPLYS